VWRTVGGTPTTKHSAKSKGQTLDPPLAWPIKASTDEKIIKLEKETLSDQNQAVYVL
jgi:hypothetical protein